MWRPSATIESGVPVLESAKNGRTLIRRGSCVGHLPSGIPEMKRSAGQAGKACPFGSYPSRFMKIISRSTSKKRPQFLPVPACLIASERVVATKPSLFSFATPSNRLIFRLHPASIENHLHMMVRSVIAFDPGHGIPDFFVLNGIPFLFTRV